jgi:hypothetical protein
MRNKFLSKILVITLILVSFKAFANDSKQYNIYLIPSKKAHDYIKSFDNSLAATGILEKYQVTPFLKNHPVHLTLYLTSFQQKHISDIEDQLQNIADNTEIFDIKTKNFTAGKSGFLMLDISNSKKLQKLSNKVVKELAKYRDTNYIMPDWVKYYPTKLDSFKKYGSPNTFSQFDPHLSILAADLKNNQSRANFEKDFNNAIKGINPQQSEFEIHAIGFGEVDKYGQVIKTLHIYKLNS